MAQFQKPQAFPYSYKAVSSPVDQQLAFPEIGFQMILPLNLLQVEQLLTHFRAQFDASLTTAQKTLTRIRVQQINITTGVLIKNVNLAMNKSAVSNVLDFDFDLSSFIDRKNNNIIWFGFGTDPTYIANPYLSTVNTLKIWKMDMAYTTRGVY